MSDRGTRAGYLDPVILADVDKSAVLRVQPSDSGFIDAFARQRFSLPHTIFDSKQIWNDPDIANSAENYPLFWDNQGIRWTNRDALKSITRFQIMAQGVISVPE